MYQFADIGGAHACVARHQHGAGLEDGDSVHRRQRPVLGLLPLARGLVARRARPQARARTRLLLRPHAQDYCQSYTSTG